MKHLITFENYNRKEDGINIDFISQNIQIRLNIEKVTHAAERQARHGYTKSKIISDDRIVELVELAIEDLTIALMQNKFDIVDKRGNSNRFIIKSNSDNVNLICELYPGDDFFTLKVITVMRKQDFKNNLDLVLEV